LKTFYKIKTFEVGNKKEFAGNACEIEAINNISKILKNTEAKLVIPIKDIVESHIKVLA
jgi:hypothetical protein